MYLDLETKTFYQSKEGKLYLSLSKINSELGLLVTLLDGFSNERICINEIIKDIDKIKNDIKNKTNLFDYRRGQLFNTWLKDYNIDSLLPLGHKSALKALTISYSIDEILNDLSEEHIDYMYATSLYLKQLFKQINEIKGVSVER